MITILILGFIFSAVLQFAYLNKYDVISGLATRENFAVAKAILVSIGVGMILLNVEIAMGFASYHVKPFVLGGIILGGSIFGIGMAILGYCPGTLAISAGEGSIDAIIGIIGGILGGITYTILLPYISPIIGPDLGKISLASLLGNHNILFFIIVIIIGILFVYSAYLLHKQDKDKNNKWLYSGIALAILNIVVFSSFVTNRPIGASTSYPYVGDLLTGLTNNAYFQKIATPGNWEVIFLFGAFLGGFIISLFRKDFNVILLHKNWIKYKGESPMKRVIWAFVGGFILVFGARMAGGCTSGHILSGGMQFAISSLVFAIFVAIGLLVTGKIFYKS